MGRSVLGVLALVALLTLAAVRADVVQFNTVTYMMTDDGNWTVPGPGTLRIRAWVRVLVTSLPCVR
jgi:hypothetical protein